MLSHTANSLGAIDKLNDSLATGFGPDAKSQITLKYIDGKVSEVDTVLVSIQHDENMSLEQNLQEQARYIKGKFPKANSIEVNEFGNLIIHVNAKDIVATLKDLRDDKNLSFKMLLDLFGLDMLGVREPRFEVVYNLLSFKLNNRITVKASLN